VANVLRRLQRICAHYGSAPVFCAASATISNPGEHARRLLERDVLVIDEDGSARGRKHYVFLNPKLVSPLSGLRLPAVEAARQLGGTLLQSDLQSIFFTRTRNTLEVLLKYLRDEASRLNVAQDRLAGYRGGYLPELRRKIEKGLRDGDIKTVVSTSALELGVDIGSLDVCVLVGYPGTVSSTFQRAGRVGRRTQESVVLFLARSFAMDQYVLGNPGYLFDQPREAVAIDPDNPIILTNHLKCSVFEVPMDRVASGGRGFGEAPHVDEILEFLANDLRVLKREGERYHYAAQTYPADGISLNAADMDNVVIQERESRRVLGEVDRPGAITETYEGAIYGHQGEQYIVEEFDYKNRRVWVRKVDADYYTEAETETEVRVMHLDAKQEFAGYVAHRGEVHVSTLAKAFKKIRFYTRENVGIGEIHLPPEEFETEACILVIGKELAAAAGLAPSLDRGSQAGALRGVAELIQGLVPLFVRVDPGDVRVMGELKNAHFNAPAITIYDQIPDGVGLSERIFTVHREVLAAALGVLTRCACQLGCPSCIGPSIDQGRLGKGKVEVLLRGMVGKGEPGRLLP
jgi:DEAD/DEAH box helicase domain-containing protein